LSATEIGGDGAGVITRNRCPSADRSFVRPKADAPPPTERPAHSRADVTGERLRKNLERG
jgi:hypothetical protein